MSQVTGEAMSVAPPLVSSHRKLISSLDPHRCCSVLEDGRARAGRVRELPL